MKKEEIILKDELMQRAVEFVIVTREASEIALQSQFNIEEARAAKLIELMEEAGFVSNITEGKAKREVLIKISEYENLFNTKLEHYEISNPDVIDLLSTSNAIDMIRFDHIEFCDEEKNKLSQEMQAIARGELERKIRESQDSLIAADIEDLRSFFKSKKFCLSYKTFKVKDSKEFQSVIASLGTNSYFVIIEDTFKNIKKLTKFKELSLDNGMLTFSVVPETKKDRNLVVFF